MHVRLPSHPIILTTPERTVSIKVACAMVIAATTADNQNASMYQCSLKWATWLD